MAGSHILGSNHPWQKSIFTLIKPVYCLFCIFSNMPLECQSNFHFLDLSSTGTAPEEDHKSSHCYYYHVNCWVLTMVYPPTQKKYVSIVLHFIQPQRLSTTPNFVISHHPNLSSIFIERTYVFPFYCNVWNKGQNCHFLEHFLNPLRFCFPAIAISWPKTHKNPYGFGCFLCWHLLLIKLWDDFS